MAVLHGLCRRSASTRVAICRSAGPYERVWPGWSPALQYAAGAVDIKSPDETYVSMRDKAAYYIQHGCPLVWLVYPDKRLAGVYTPGSDIDLLLPGDRLSGGEVLPGFTLAVEVVFGE